MDVNRKTDTGGVTGSLLRRALWLLWLLPLSSMAGAERIVVVADEHNPVHQQFIAAFRQQLASRTVVEVARDSAGRDTLQGASLIVSLGTLAARGLSTLSLDTPVINSLITEADWQRLAAGLDGERGRQTALYLDQPPSRMLALVKTAIPKRRQVTVALGPTSQRARAAIEQGCHRQALRCDVMLVEDEAGIDQALRRAAASGKVLLVLPDPQVVNAATARNLILGAFRRGVALVGYSRALVKAGALMAVHSTPEQLGEDAAAMVRRVLDRGEQPPASHYPAHYSVSVNYQLARALRLDLKAEKSLEQTLHKAERNE